MGFHEVLLGFTGSYCVLLGFTGFNWSLNEPWTGLMATEFLDQVGSCAPVLSTNR